MNLPEGVNVEMVVDKSTGGLAWSFTFTEEYIKATAINILNTRIDRAKVALPLCKHTKRKHRLTKLLQALERARETIEDDDLPRPEGSA